MTGRVPAPLAWRARLWRVVHAAWSVAQLACLGRIWIAVATGHRSPAVWGSAAFLGVEGAALLVGHGDCPVGPLQESWGDPVPFFELLLPPRAARAAVPILAAVSAVAVGGLVLRAPGLRIRA